MSPAGPRVAVDEPRGTPGGCVAVLVTHSTWVWCPSSPSQPPWVSDRGDYWRQQHGLNGCSRHSNERRVNACVKRTSFILRGGFQAVRHGRWGVIQQKCFCPMSYAYKWFYCVFMQGVLCTCLCLHPFRNDVAGQLPGDHPRQGSATCSSRNPFIRFTSWFGNYLLREDTLCLLPSSTTMNACYPSVRAVNLINT